MYISLARKKIINDLWGKTKGQGVGTLKSLGCIEIWYLRVVYISVGITLWYFNYAFDYISTSEIFKVAATQRFRHIKLTMHQFSIF